MKIPVVLSIACLLLAACKDTVTDQSDPGPTFTAGTRFSAVNTYAQTYAPGCRFFGIFAPSVDIGGKAAQWSYCFFDSGGSHPVYYFHANRTQVAYDSTKPMPTGASVITTHWFDSDSALLVAERNGGSDYRQANPGYGISARLSEAVVPNAVPYWFIIYTSSTSIAKGLMIDATSGALLGQTR